MALAASPLHERKRVKVYELRDQDWFDRGTGFCAVQTISDEGEIIVGSEEDPKTELLKIAIKKDDNYQKQQDTLIVWTDPDNGQDMALSFQEAEGCGVVWDTINEAQSQIEGYVRPPVLQSLDLPPPTLGELETIETILRNGSNTQGARDVVVKHLISDGYLLKLLRQVETAEDLQSIEDLHRLCTIMKQLVLYNDNQIVECLIQDEVFEWAVGALEYDPDFPHHKANHREFLSNSSRFKEVVHITDDDIRRKIHYTYRLQYLKDVALARVLDDQSFSLFNSLIYFHQIDIVQHIASNGPLLQELFSIIGSRETPMTKKKDAIAFIQQSCQIAKTLQAPCRASLYHNMINAGLFGAVNFALQHRDSVVRVAGTDILVAIIDHDMLMMRNTIYKSANEHMSPMTDTLIDLLLVETDVGVKAQVADAIKVLLDSNPNSNPADRNFGAENSILAKFRTGALNNANKIFLEHHLQPSMKKLFQPLMELDQRETLTNLSIQESSLFSHLVEILSFFIRQPANQSKNFILSEGLIPRAARLLTCPEKHVKLTAIKFFRTCVAAVDQGEHYIRSLIQNNIFEQILDLIIALMPRDSLLMSACLELFEFVRFNHIKTVVVHVVENLREKVESINFVPLFRSLINEYDMLMDPNCPTPRHAGDMDSSFMTSDAGSPHTRHEIIQGGGSRWQGLRDTSVDEDAYFSTADDEEDELSRDHGAPNGASPLAKPLVDYGDDDDDEESVAETPPNANKSFRADEDHSSSPSPGQNASSSEGDIASSSSTPPPTTPPPPSIAEKRRREEDEDDELGKLAASNAKRRNSSSNVSVASTSSWEMLDKDEHEDSPNNPSRGSPDVENEDSPGGLPKLQTLRRKRAFGPGVGPAGGGRKIAISLATASKEQGDGNQKS